MSSGITATQQSVLHDITHIIRVCYYVMQVSMSRPVLSTATIVAAVYAGPLVAAALAMRGAA